MQIPLEVTYPNFPPPPAIHSLIEEQAKRLERFCGNIIRTRVTVEKPHKHQRSGNPYRVRIEVTIPPNHYLVVTKGYRDSEQHDDLSVVVRGAFRTMERNLRKHVQQRRGDIKPRTQSFALVDRILADKGYGFLRNSSGQSIYFHRNAVLHNDFDRLTVGSEVRFTSHTGEQGLQASSVQIINKPGKRLEADTSK